ncbi:caspase family protein, partial [Alphaproteobacteria bacterium]|nr:caspase family protein [Alphaproteobacteria bacterium]
MNFSKITIKIEDEKKIETIIAYNEILHLTPKIAKFMLIFKSEKCVGKLIIKKQSSFKFLCVSGYNANGIYYRTKNAIDAFGKGTDSNNKRISFRLDGVNNNLKNDFKRIVDNFENYNLPKSTISAAELDASKREADKLRKKLIALENKQKQEQQKIASDNQQPVINTFTKQNGSNATISGRVTDNTEVAEVLIDGQVQQLSSNGTFETKFYIPRTGKTVEIVAFDIKGNKASKLLKIERGNVQQASGPKFDTLNPSGKRVKFNPNALALIIGVADYEKTKADALYADKDAQQFYDYATMKLGIPSSNIKELVNDKADLGEILINVKEWLRRSTKPNKSDIFIYFAGHGLASQDGNKMYLLPYDGRPRLLENTALLRDELFKDIKQANPKSVTVFLDTCYSGVTRNEEMLIAGRPIVIKAKEQAIPDGFTLFSAASNEQISRPLEEAKHGMFSYFLMK